MALTQEQMAIVEGALRERFGGTLPACPLCRGRIWSAQDMISPPVVSPTGNLVLMGRPNLPLVPLACNGCWHVIFFAASRVGLLEPDPTDLADQAGTLPPTD